MADIQEKECFKCKDTLVITLFPKNCRMKDGRLNKCKACVKKDAANVKANGVKDKFIFKDGMRNKWSCKDLVKEHLD